MQVQLARKKFAAAAIWACAAAAVAGVAYQGNAEATVRQGAVQCDEGDFVVTTIFEPVMEVPGAVTPREALEALSGDVSAAEVAGLQAVQQADDHVIFARGESGKQRMVAEVSDKGGWRLDATTACVDEKGGRS